jgi:MoaA/NifB/PqqE/SkfB family radical SAM enzyme
MSMIRQLFSRTIPGQLVIQFTDRCNALCPQCGMRRTESFPRSKLSMDDAKRIIDAAAVRGVRALSFTGGEPLLYLDEIAELIDHATAAGIPYVRTGTNGYLFMHCEHSGFERRVNAIAERLSRTKLYTFWISVDSAVPTVHETMRGLPGVFNGIEKALPIFHEHGIYPSANLGINRNTGGPMSGTIPDEQLFYAHFWSAFRNFYRTVEGMGFTIVNACYPMSAETNTEPIKPVYQATSKDNVVNFSSSEKAVIFRALFDVIPDFRSRIRIFTPRSSLIALIRQHNGDYPSSYACRGGQEFFFVDAKNGDTFPCGYRGAENLGKFWDQDFPLAGMSGNCRKCDWECFRDPSELFGPLHDFMTKPGRFVFKMVRDSKWRRLWYEDLQYFRACDFFNGRVPPDTSKLERFVQKTTEYNRSQLENR